jgi:phosphatidylglycerophosphate synthase
MSSQPVSSCFARILGDCDTRLWSLSSRERLLRQLEKAGVTRLLDDVSAAGSNDSVVLFRADYLYDARTIRDLVATGDVLLEAPGAGAKKVAVAAHVPVSRVEEATREIESGQVNCTPRAIDVRTPDTLSPAYVAELLKSEPPTVLRIARERQTALEHHLFDGSYKGVTDLVTKWVWPRPARWVTRWCARARIRPNTVTSVSIALVVVAAWFFATGRFQAGLLAAWFMTFLDTVDGKLARVTVDSTKLGHVLDHGLDIVHPPFWYVAWGAGLAASATPLDGATLYAALAAIVAGYVVGRLVEGAFDFWLGRFSLFCWRPIDSYFRLVMARRNPNLILLTVATLAGRPDVGLVAVAVWTVASSVFLLFRFAVGLYRRATDGLLRPWLADVRAEGTGTRRVARPFARQETAHRLFG